jgi:hypothetical protein
MNSEYPIPRNLQEAFKEVVYRYAAREWTPDGPDLEVSIDFKSYSFETACGFVDIFDDPLPEDLLDLLLAQMHDQDSDLRSDLASKKSYSSGARSLRLLIQRRKDAFREREKARGERG